MRSERWRILGRIAVLFLALNILIGGTIVYRALNREDLGMVNPLEGGFGTSLTSTTLGNALAAISTSRRTLLITPGTWTISSNLTIPANVTLMVASGGTLAINTGVTLTINGGFEAPDTAVFSQTGTGKVRFTKLTRLKAIWWGMACDDSTNDLTALNALMASVADGSTIELPYGVCRVGAWDVTGVRGLVFEGAGASPIGAFAADGVGTTLKAAGSQTYLMRLANVQYLRFNNIAFDGNLQTSNTVIFMEYDGGPASHITFERVIVTRTADETGQLVLLGGASNLQVDYVVFRDSIIDQDMSGGGTLADRCVKVVNTNTFLNWIYNSRISNCIHGVEMLGGSMSLYGIDFGHATVAHVQINQSAQSFTVADSYTESDTPQFLRTIEGANPIEGAPVIYLERNTINIDQAASVWKLTQPLVMTANTFSQTAFTVTTLGDTRSKYRVTAVGNRFSGDGIGFGGTGLSSVDEVLTQHVSTAGVVTSQTIMRANVKIEATLSPDAITIGPGGTPVSRLQGFTFTDNFGSITAGQCAESTTEHDLTGPTVTLGSFFGGHMDIATPTGFLIFAKSTGTNKMKFSVCNFSGTNADPDGTGAGYTAYLVLP